MPNRRLRGSWFAIAVLLSGSCAIFAQDIGTTAVGQADTSIVALGARLFDDPALSGGGRTACSTCHMPSRYFADGLARSVGDSGHPARRNTPTLLSAAGRTTYFWDGVETDLRSAVQRPLFDPDEMGNLSSETLLETIKSRRGYEADFAGVFGSTDISLSRVADALVAYLRDIDASFRHDAKVSQLALAWQQRAGLRIFRGKAGCGTCHTGASLTDDSFHNTGLAMPGEAGVDPGRFSVTGTVSDAGRFRTPSLIAVANTAPYMHNGAFTDLDMVIRFYERGGGSPWLRNQWEEADPVARSMATVSSKLRAFELTAQEREALLAFLKTL
ncbi:cytochrome-c peroxidase [Rhizobium panacihumi]|uniref:cytochrome-c peroxidase n=1 Tax=Rhizobium panacihumi TaxID=2008450 RepID=UPI003D7B24CD